MQGHPEVIDALNGLLTADLTAVDVYFLQARVCQDRGYTKLQAHFEHEQAEEQVHVTLLMDRILLLGGMPNVQDRIGFVIDADMRVTIQMDLDLESNVAKSLNEGIALCRTHGDNGSRELLERLLAETENDHILWLESQLRLIDDIGLPNYLSEQI